MRLEERKLLEDIRQAADAIQRYIQGKSQNDYLQDDQLQASVERKFEIIGEALNRLYRRNPDIAEKISDYRQIIAFRNTLIHGYSAVDARVVWDILSSHLPRLQSTVGNLLQA